MPQKDTSSSAFAKPKPVLPLNLMSSINSSLPALPPPRLSLDLEPNPFEQSFKERESSTRSSSNGISDTVSGNGSQANRLSNGSLNSKTGNSSSPPILNAPQFLTPGGRRILPPMSAIASPSSLIPTTSSNSWTDSLRSGPLSPAMLQGPQTQQSNTTTAGPTNSLLGLASTSAAIPPLTSTSSSTIRPGPLSPFSADLLPSDNSLFPTPGPATAAILSSLNSEIIGSTGLTPLPLKPSTGTPTGTSTTLTSVTDMSGLNSRPINELGTNPLAPTLNNANSLNGSIAQRNRNSNNSFSILPPISQGHPQPHNQQPVTSNQQQLQQQQQQQQQPSQSQQPNTNDQFNGSVNAAESLYLMSKSVSSQPSVKGNMETESSVNTSTTRTKRSLSQANSDDNDYSNSVNNNENASEPPTKKPSKGRGRKSKTQVKKEPKSEEPSSSVELSNGHKSKAKSSSSASNISTDSKSSTTTISRAEKKKLSEEEKRKSFLERNRIAALKCRQRKKQWLEELQQKVEQYSSENEKLNQQVISLRDEVIKLKSVLLHHKDCSVGMSPEILTLFDLSNEGSPNTNNLTNGNSSSR